MHVGLLDVAWPPCDSLVIPPTSPAAAGTGELEVSMPAR